MLALIAWFVWFIVSTPRMVRDCYGQWDTATLIIWFHKQNNRLPANWDELKQVYEEGDGLRGGLKFEQIKNTVVVEFARLVELEKLARNTSRPPTLPEIVYPKSGRHG